MTRFIQIHAITNYPASNLNRDDMGRPKTCIVGGQQRLRISSQSLKRAWRSSDVFQAALVGKLGNRTRQAGTTARDKLVAKGVSEADATKWGAMIAGVFGKVEKDKLDTQQLVHIGPEEWQAIDALVDDLAGAKKEPSEDQLKGLLAKTAAADVGMFGRMLAADPAFNVDAAVQVAHAFTTHPVTVEDDYFTAVDDLKRDDDDCGAGHVGVSEFGAGAFYTYVCIDRESLIENIGDETLANAAIKALVEAIATVSPSGKQNSYASRAWASYMLVEKGTRQPRTLAEAFLATSGKGEIVREAVDSLTDRYALFDKVYGEHETRMSFDVGKGEGSMGAIATFAAEP